MEDNTQVIEDEEYDNCSFAQEIARRKRAYAASLPRESITEVTRTREPVDVLDCSCGHHIAMMRPKTALECYKCHYVWEKVDGKWVQGEKAPPLAVLRCGCGNRFPVYGTGTARKCFRCGGVWVLDGGIWARQDGLTIADAPVKGMTATLGKLVAAQQAPDDILPRLKTVGF